MVYHGPSAGCKACRSRRVKCDQSKPSCNNCIRRRTACPGYDDVFDGAHRSQNKVVIRMLEKKNAARDGDSTTSTPSSEMSLASTPASSVSSVAVPTTKPQGPLQWIIYSAPQEKTDSEEDSPPPEVTNSSHRTAIENSNVEISLRHPMKPHYEEASVNFFFRHYTGITCDPHLHNHHAILWQPLYLASSPNSPLKLATAAVTVNITMMWSFKGCDARPARTLFTQALAATREAINNPIEYNMDELLMTILVFDLYDALVLHYRNDSSTPYGKHKSGALALLKHRGQSNYATVKSRALTEATRNLFLDYSLAQRIPMPEGSADILSHPSISTGKGRELDLLTIEAVNLQARLWALRRKTHPSQLSVERRRAFEEIIAEAIRIDQSLMDWKRSIKNSDWLPKYVPLEEVEPSILAAGFYGTKCAVWVDLVSADMFNTHLARRLSTLQMIRQSLADEPALLADQKYRTYLAKANATSQALIDAIVETIPAHLGDTLVPTNPIYCSEIKFPYTITSDPITGELRTFPDFEGSDYKMRAAAGGGWMIFPHLVSIYRLVEPEDDAEPLILRDGQLDWIKGQVKRLQHIFLFCDPVWFKRGDQRWEPTGA